MRLRLFENFRAVFYAPFYAAHATGAYEAEGVGVELLPSPGPGRGEAALVEGVADVMWAGPMRVMKRHDDTPSSPLVCLAEVVCRDPFSLVGREPKADFPLTDLARLRLATVSEVPTPWLCLQEDLRQLGLDPAKLERVSDQTMARNLAALSEGQIAAAQLFEPFVEEALASGAGHLWYQASSRGRTSYTAFIVTRELLERDGERLLRLVRAVYRTQRWLHAQPPGEVAAAIASFFPAVDRRVLTGALARYKMQGVWGRDPVLSEEGFERLGRSLLSGGFIRRPPVFAECVDTRLARQAMTG